MFFIEVSLLTGIVMGGGAGVSLHGKFRVATNNTVFAMPETSLGLFPDVGASYFLARLPGFYGEYVALVGARLDGAEMLACGLATHFVPSNVRAFLINSKTYVWFTISLFFHSLVHLRLEIINKCFSKRTVEEIISSLEEVASNSASKWVAQTIKYLKKASPTSLKITLRSIREGRTQTVGECLQREYRMVCHVVRGDFSRDIFEGCRAILVDKDKNPKWMPPRLEQVHDDAVEEYFSRVDDPEWEDLDLPVMYSNGRIMESKL
ncbi:3-hydroxyisobutyryl-CoA hydrolase 1 [Zea mays]|uniref:3-hydroxyisobutyryl-CoA hydrolase n=1 Tax=Zea mays TaxID=4577 RepID=A0A1D6F8I0_MAIZE|nr:3-hydroxyisobutyryl-CoA hydrolase 1 [Zea mays]